MAITADFLHFHFSNPLRKLIFEIFEIYQTTFYTNHKNIACLSEAKCILAKTKSNKETNNEITS